MSNPGFYKLQNDQLLYAPKAVYALEFTLQAATRTEYTYPVDGWRWFDDQGAAEVFLGINGQPLNPDYQGLKAELEDSNLYDIAVIKQTPARTIGEKSARAQNGGSNFLTLAASAPTDDNAYRGGIMSVTLGLGVGETFLCTGYNGTTKRADFVRLSGDGSPFVMDGTTRYFMLPMENIYDIATSSAAVWAIQRTTDRLQAALSRLAANGDGDNITKISKFQTIINNWVTAVNFSVPQRDVLRGYLAQYASNRSYTVPV